MRFIFNRVFVLAFLLAAAPVFHSAYAVQEDSQEPKKIEKPKDAGEQAEPEKSDDADKAKKEKKKIRKQTYLYAGTLLAIPGTKPVNEQTIIIEKGKIVEVKAGYIEAVSDKTLEITTIDMKDKFVMPGLMDMHTHIAFERKGPYKDAMLSSVIHAEKSLKAGYTTIRDLGARDKSIYKLRKAIKKGDIAGPRIFTAGITIGVGDRGDKACNGPESCRRATRANISEGADWIKIYASCSGFSYCSHGGGAPVFFDDEIEAILETAKKYDVKVAAHSHPRDAGAFVLKYDVKSIEHGSFLSKATLRKMKKNDVFFVPTLAVQDMLDQEKKAGKEEPRRRAHNQSFMDQVSITVANAYKIGVKIATGSDAGVVPHGKNYREIERLVEFGVTNADALKMATVNGADLLGKSKELGTIEKDKFADIIAIDGDPLAKIKDIRNIVLVMKDGKRHH